MIALTVPTLAALYLSHPLSSSLILSHRRSFAEQVSTPLALNIYTAVHNPISVKGRIQLCRGALAHVDTRPVLSQIDIPVICIQSTQNNFVKPLHTDPYVSRRGGEVRSIHKVRFPQALYPSAWLCEH